MQFDLSKPGCGVCGRQDVPLRYLRTTPDGERLYVCRNKAECNARFARALVKRPKFTKALANVRDCKYHCGYVYNDRTAYREHLANQHGEK